MSAKTNVGCRVTNKILMLLGAIALLAGLSLPPGAPEIANIAVLSLSALGLLVLGLDRNRRLVMRQPAVWLPLLALAIVTLALLPTARSPEHVLAILILAPLFLVGPLAALLRRLGPWMTPKAIAVFALVGAASAAAIAMNDIFVRGLARGGEQIQNAIHFADVTLTIGFVAAVGILGLRTPWRLVFILGPLLAVVAVVLANSRGPLIATVPVTIVAVTFLVAQFLARRWIVPTAVLTLIVVLAAGYAAYALGFADRLARLANVFDLFSSGTTTDNSVGERAYMLASAWNAFLASPIYGHGLIDYTQAAASHAPPGPLLYPPSQHLHNDLADFAVIGGTLGLVAYLLLMAAPLVGAFKVRGRWRRAAIYLGLVVPVGYLAMGLTNAMIGILTQTVAYAVILAIIAALDDPQTSVSADRGP